jgi:transposase-like protein
VKSAIVHANSLAHYSIVHARAWAADSINARVRPAADNDRIIEECVLLPEELRIKDARTVRIPPQRRPHYSPHERMGILELRAARGWSLKQTADTFFLTSTTIAWWVKRLDEQGPIPADQRAPLAVSRCMLSAMCRAGWIMTSDRCAA